MSESYRKMHETLDVWKLSMELVLQVHTVTKRFPMEERFALVQQIRRAAYSIPSNIAEGAARETPKENLRALYYSRGSLAELETQLEIARRLGYDIGSVDDTVGRVSRSLSGYIRYTKRKIQGP